MALPPSLARISYIIDVCPGDSHPETARSIIRKERPAYLANGSSRSKQSSYHTRESASFSVKPNQPAESNPTQSSPHHQVVSGTFMFFLGRFTRPGLDQASLGSSVTPYFHEDCTRISFVFLFYFFVNVVSFFFFFSFFYVKLSYA